ncbi:hypothetical protein Patl1_03740 [Pistacia atlantica]|uniref:Uncharacterized protein n=1 Tax=Pistacia atlantica TaxID=434234 RepID=A0ACC1BVB9_9ROSI|nr:hypothetical protein Patl1_03740 [Pistacia atlantica]
MAEFTVNFAIETLASLLFQETNLLRRVKKEVESIKRELEFIRSFLKNADTGAPAEEEGESNGGIVSTWVKQVRIPSKNTTLPTQSRCPVMEHCP